MFKRSNGGCKNCNKYTFNFFDLLTMLDGKNASCKICETKFKSNEPWVFIFHLFIGVIPILGVLFVVFFGIYWGLFITCIIFLSFSAFLTKLMPIIKCEKKN